MPRNPNCQLCKLHKSAEFVCLWGAGPKRTEVMIIGEGPGHREDEKGTAFVGRSGQLLDQVLQKVGLSREDIYITNATKCKPAEGVKPRGKEIAACKIYLNQEFASVKPKFVAILGGIALKSVLGLEGIKKYRGRPIEQEDVIYFPMYHPSFILHNDLKDLAIFEADMRQFANIVTKGGLPEEKNLNSRIIETWKDVDDLMEALTGVVSMDIETTKLYPWAQDAAIVTIGFGTEKGEFSLFDHHNERVFKSHEILKIVARAKKKIEEDCILVTQNGKFDVLWVKVHYDIEFKMDFDTMMAHYLVDENLRHDLTFLSQLHFGSHDWDIPLSEKQGGASAQRISKYHAYDLYYTRRLYFPLRERLRADPLLWRLFTNLTMPCVNLYWRMEYNGAYVDEDRMDDAEEYLKNEVETAEASLKKWDEKTSWTSPKQVAHLLFDVLGIKPPLRTPKGAPSTSEDALNLIDHDCVADLKRLRAAKQEKSFFIDGWKPYIIDHRLHPSFKLHGTVTGRPSCEHPNFQQTTREPRIRSLIIAAPGFELLEADLSQIELRIVAQLSREPNMCEAFQKGWDIHWTTALREIERGGALKNLVLGTAGTLHQRKITDYGEAIKLLLEAGVEACEEVDRSWKEYRKRAKAINFGYVFGMWWKRFKVYALSNYGVKLTDEEAQASRIAFFQMYGLEDWHKTAKAFAQRRGYIRTLTGQKRRLPEAMSRNDSPERAEALRQSINSPVQGFAAHMLLMVLIQMTKEFSWEVFRPFATVHDALLAEVRKDYVERVAERIEEIMQHPDLFDVFDIEFTIPLSGEVKIGPWGSGISVQKWRKANAKEHLRNNVRRRA